MNALVRLTAVLVAVAAAWFGVQYWTAAAAVGGPLVRVHPPIFSVAEMNELVTLKLNMNTTLEARNNWYEGVWIIAGDALIATEYGKAEFGSINTDRKTFNLTLPAPRVITCRVNHELTRSVSLRSISWNPAQLVYGNKDEIREEAMKQAQRKLEREASQYEHVQRAKAQAETILKKQYGELGWKCNIAWRTD